jgi:hypothetical protein
MSNDRCKKCNNFLCWCGIKGKSVTVAELIDKLQKLPDKDTMLIVTEIIQDNSLYTGDINGIKRLSEIVDYMPVNEDEIRAEIKDSGDKYVITSYW